MYNNTVYAAACQGALSGGESNQKSLISSSGRGLFPSGAPALLFSAPPGSCALPPEISGSPLRPGPFESSACRGRGAAPGGQAAPPGSSGRSSGGPAVLRSPLDESSRAPSLGGASSGPGPGPGAGSSAPGPGPEAVSSGPPVAGGPFNSNLLAKVLSSRGKCSRKSKKGALGLGEKWAELDRKRRENGRRAGKNEAEVFGPKIHRDIRCGAWALIRSCSDGHTFGKTLDCGREWCEICKSSSHGRRIARWLPKLQKIETMAYLVVTFPVEKRPRTMAGLEKFSWVITEILKRRGFVRGLRHWHFFGDKSQAWNPHLNFLMDRGFISPGDIEAIKKEICEELGLGQVVLNYAYSRVYGKKFHWIRYVLRATFLHQGWDFKMAEELFNFRNSAAWGQWEEGRPLKTKKLEELRQARIEAGFFEDKWALPEKEKKLAYFKKVEAGLCPTCGKKLEGGRVVSTDYFTDEKNRGWEKIWENVWQLKGPPENVLIYRLFKDYAATKKEAAPFEVEGAGLGGAL